MTWDVILGYASGLRFVTPEMDAATLLRTLAIVHACDAALCRVVAKNHRRSQLLWTAAGFVFGLWAVAAAILPFASRRELQD